MEETGSTYGRSWGLDEGLTSSHRKKKKLVIKCYARTHKCTDSLERLRQWKLDVKSGIWNVMSFCRGGSLKTVQYFGWKT